MAYDDEHTLRGKWQFSYPADVLHKAAQERLAFYKTRLAWWRVKKEEVKAKIKDEGLEFDESLAASEAKFSVSNYSRDTTVNVRGDLLRDLREAQERIRAHAASVKVYDGWVQMLATQGSASLELTQKDWLFFFSKPSVEDEKEGIDDNDD